MWVPIPRDVTATLLLIEVHRKLKRHGFHAVPF
jgi:hypothetical protein